MTRSALVFCLLFLNLQGLLAQRIEEYPGRPRYPEGLLALQLGGGVTKYAGEFSDETTGLLFLLRGMYSVSPEFSVGLNAEIGNASFHRRARRTTGTTYGYQFKADNNVLRETPFEGFHILTAIDFFPRMYFNTYMLLGAGVTLYKPKDYLDDAVRYRPKNDNLAAFTLPAGLGAEFFLTRNITVNAEFLFHYLFADNFDAFPSQEVRDKFLSGVIKPESAESADDGNDGYFTLSAGLRVFLFENEDIDGDLLKNREEETIGTNPYDQDTDGDGLTDYEEVRSHHTLPLNKDTDGEGLNDYVEVMKYHTDPLKADSDDDGLNDFEEVQKHHTDPMRPDTDAEGLQDGREVRIGSNPGIADSDRDGLNDFEEAEQTHTDPLKPDSDSDSLSDYEESTEFRTDPLKPDTDGDGLTDGEEVKQHHTDPLAPDTDGDTLSDFAEIRKIGTDPLKRDTDDDGIADNLDRCPLAPETYNGYQDTDGCPDSPSREIATGPGGRASRDPSRAGFPSIPGVAGQPGFPGDSTGVGASGLWASRMDTMTLHEGEIVTLFGVNFEVDKDIIRPESYPILEEDAKLFLLYPELIVEIRGHTDSDASSEYNQKLSQRRAESVKRFLVQRGVAPERMITKGFAFSKPVAPNTDVFGKARNRRIEFYIVKSGDRVVKDIMSVPVDSTRQVKSKSRPRKR